MKANLNPKVEIPKAEAGRWVVQFTKVEKDGKRTKDVTALVPYNGKDYKQVLSVIERQSISVLGYDEMELVHDPDKYREDINKQGEAAATGQAKKPATEKEPAAKKSATTK